jgi:hypothetical protein
VNVLGCAYINRNIHIKEPENESKKLAALRQFRGTMLSFQQAVLRVRNYYEGDSEIDILMRLIDHLRDDVQLIQEDQTIIKENLVEVCGFIDRIGDNNGELQKMLVGSKSSSSFGSDSFSSEENRDNNKQQDEDDHGGGHSKIKQVIKQGNDSIKEESEEDGSSFSD